MRHPVSIRQPEDEGTLDAWIPDSAAGNLDRPHWIISLLPQSSYHNTNPAQSAGFKCKGTKGPSAQIDNRRTSPQELLAPTEDKAIVSIPPDAGTRTVRAEPQVVVIAAQVEHTREATRAGNLLHGDRHAFCPIILDP